MIQGLLGPIASLAGTWLNGKVETKAAETKAKVARAEAEAQIMVSRATSEADWEKIMAQGTQNSWKDEYLVLLFSIPLILAFLPFEWADQAVANGFAALETMPQWYSYTLGVIVASSFAVRSATKFFRKQVIMTKEARVAAGVIKEVTKEQEGYSKNSKKQTKLDMESFGDNKNDPALKRAVNFIERIGVGRQMLMNYLSDAYQKKDIKEARKIASEIVRNVDPNKSVKSQIESLPSFGSIRGSVKGKLELREKFPRNFSRGGLNKTSHTDYRAKGLFK